MKIANATKSDLKFIKKVYIEAFPKNERKPFFMIMSKVKQEKSELLTFTDNGKFVGFASTLIYKDRVLVDYFAMSSHIRGGGYGSNALKLILDRYKDSVVMLEVEDLLENSTNYAQRVKRYNFYLKNGMIDGDMKILMFKNQFRVLSYPRKVTFDEFISVHNNVMGKGFTKFIGIKRI